MKNNQIFKIFLLILLSINFSISYGQEFNFQAGEIELLDKENKLRAKNGVITTSNDGIEIRSDVIEYDKIKLILQATGNVKVTDKINKIIINGEKILFYKKDNIILSKESTTAQFEDGYFLETKNIIFDNNLKIISSDYKTTLKDQTGNSFEVESFNYSILKKILKGKKIKLADTEKNKYYLENASINFKNDEAEGKILLVEFNNSSFGNSENEPRLKGESVFLNKDKTVVQKGSFTTCKKRDKCPPWIISADRVEHNKNKKIIKYKNAWLKIYDVPILYFPKFYHPDPTVKRQSGFLIPRITNSNVLGSSINIPYFKVISKNRDLTFTPQLYADQNPVLQTEYRHVTENAKHIIDTSFNEGYKIDNKKTNGRRVHFFSNSLINMGLNGFDESNLEINVQQVSNDTYLKFHQIKSKLITEYSTLKSNLNFEASKKNFNIKTSLEVYENLGKNKSDRYEYIFPNFGLVKDIDITNGYLTFESNGFNKNFDTNVKETVVINNLSYQSNPYYLKSGIKNSFSGIIKNVNTNGKNSTKYKENEEYEILSSYLFESSFPLKKEGEKIDSFFTPKISLMYSPNKTKNLKNEKTRLDISNIFSFDRLSANETVEGGQSLTIGTSYKKTNKKEERNLLELNLAKVFRDEKNDDLPLTSTIGNKSSDIFGNLILQPNKHLDFDYSFQVDNNLSTTNYNMIKTQLNVNNFVTSFEFLEERNLLGNESYLSNKTNYQFDKNHSLGFSTRKNKRTDLTEFYNLIYEYKNDCLRASLEYNKNYYNDNDVIPEEQFYFSLTITPLGTTGVPATKTK